MSRSCGLLVVLLAAGFLAAQPIATRPEPNTPRPIEALDTVFVEEMTWMEVRDALKAGKTTVIMPTGGVEQNGPYLATGKHNYILRGTAEAIARKLGSLARKRRLNADAQFRVYHRFPAHPHRAGAHRVEIAHARPANKRRGAFPYLLHGIGGDENEWPRGGSPNVILDNLYAD